MRLRLSNRTRPAPGLSFGAKIAGLRHRHRPDGGSRSSSISCRLQSVRRSVYRGTFLPHPTDDVCPYYVPPDLYQTNLPGHGWELRCPELLVLAGEAGVRSERFDVARRACHEFFLRETTRDQFYCRALFVKVRSGWALTSSDLSNVAMRYLGSHIVYMGAYAELCKKGLLDAAWLRPSSLQLTALAPPPTALLGLI